MGPLILAIVAALCAMLLATALVAVARPRLAAPLTAGLAALGTLVALVHLLAGAPAAALSLPIGLPGLGVTLGVDGVSSVFLLLVLLVAAAASASAIGDDHYLQTAALLPVFVAGMVLTLLAADGFALASGFELMSVASLVLVLTHHREAAVRQAALLYGGMATLSALCLFAAIGLLAHGAGLDFAAMRAAPPEGLRAVAILALVVLGVGSKAGLLPLHGWLPPAHAAAPAHVSALMSGVMTKVALYVLVRVLFDLCGPAQPLWFGLPLVILGGCGAALGGLRATVEADVKSVLACSTVENIGFIAVGLGVALLARGADLPELASLALAAALLHVLAHGVFKPLMFLGAGAVQAGAGTRRLEWLGGLIHRMPITSACMILGAANLAGLPPMGGFAGEWLIFQTVLTASRVGGLAVQLVLCITAGLLALGAALAGAAAIRLIGIALLGRPRGPRAAAAEEPAPWPRRAMLALAGLVAVIGLAPGGIVALVAPALRALSGADMAGRASLLRLAPVIDMPGYSALGALLLLLLALGGIAFWRRGDRAPALRGPAWDCGFGADTARLPFGEPLTQYSAAGFSQPLRRALGATVLAARETVMMPEPGDTSVARLSVAWADPADAWLFAPAARLRHALSRLADTMQFLRIGTIITVITATLVLFLVAVAMVEQL